MQRPSSFPASSPHVPSSSPSRGGGSDSRSAQSSAGRGAEGETVTGDLSAADGAAHSDSGSLTGGPR